MKKLAILVLVIGFIALLYGCCSHSHNAVFVNPNGDTVITSKEVIIDELGRLPTVIFPSGAKIEGLEENTLNPGIVVSIVEQKTTPQNNAFFDGSTRDGIYLYKITAYQSAANLAGGKIYVSTTEKPIKITLPKSSDSQELVLAGIKESDTDPWRLFDFSDSDEILANIAEIRASQTVPKECTFNLFRLGTQFALVSYGGNAGNKLPETYVTSLVASSTHSILVKDGTFLEDFTFKGILKGTKLDSIKPTDLRARITYRNNVADEAPIKVNGVNITQTSKADNTVPGYTYCHSFLVDSVTESNLMSNSGEFAFTLDLDGIETQSFSNGFLIEFFNKVDSEKVMPYNYTEFYTVKQVGVYNIVYDLDGGSVDTANPTTYSEASSTFTLTNPTKTGYTFIGWSGTGLTGNNNLTVTIEQGSTGDRTYTANWSENPPDAYTLVLNKGAGVATVTGGGSYMAGVEVTATCTMLAGYEFANWSGDFSTGTFTMPENDVSMTANSRPISYTISYNLDGGTENTNPTAYDITSATITLISPTKDHHMFVGWTGSNGNTPQTTVTIEQGSTGDKEFTANWSINSYRLDIVKGTGINTVTGDGLHEYNSVVNVSYTMLDGYEFANWSGDLTTETFNMPASNATMTANARPISYSITCNLDGGTADNPTSYDVTSATITLNNPSKLGYEFTGWSGTGLTGNDNMAVSIAQGSNGDRTYTAHWSLVSYTITCNLNDGTLETANPTSYDVTSATINLTNPTKNGYTFTGWSGTGLTGNENMTVTIEQGSIGNKEFTANWSINSYRLDIIAGTGIYTVTGDGMHEYDSSVTASCTMLAGYEFDKWTGDITTETFNMPADNATMTANAKLINYTITYNLNGGTVATANPTSYDITSATIILNNPTKENCYFGGWSGTGLDYASSTLSIVQGSTGNRTYTAVWIEVLTFTMPNGVELVMHKIPAGAFERFQNGSNSGTKQTITISEPFYIGRFEVTQDQYFSIMNTNPSIFKEGSSASVRPTTSANYPVEYVRWNDIMTATTGFIDKINTQLSTQIPTGYRFDLPTEAQWEYACRAGTTTDFNNGTNRTGSKPDTNLNDLAWYTSNSTGKTHNVGEKLPNAWGLYDMHGNVWEWCKDWYATYESGNLQDPVGPESGSRRVLRGGGWCNDPYDCRSAYRLSDIPTSRYTSYGFRVALIPVH